ncbi:type I glyceraldehyde-3-phosphate dehydrogenase [Candidatus Daviesbacteria bacterium RIFCSPLOWO2_01_FULL_39_12]|uniref:Glyceraldehyde-3-phosphate dehydrogenase n=1 Tax=Candidatus Daviesbacteria bacterium RIFCSPLOWO2_01_FULL_39_12 TaxID=1797785 RepID=A0A1F5KTK9_9BACT|nr:MAG: type I glyceraldehyde-3-phosphate dehydrogenase [Candidatus Daviesbacteria bacterium RIFCSPHIGHO2_02_FULL_39_8]OGE44252.1 MAG: type I glyceraldehyde-3-phosphate dehydrogenase [Candidatus Daviesbacteria bacterium RIFCSPLOWO2_01_FULL_39_12]HLC97048.1 type I glyceraldehyde-3-phosphate dehydrogenase [Candidatus Nanoarchaeia archaeon]
MIRVAINGFGRIGRTAFKIALDKHADEVEVIGINDLTDAKTLAHLLKYDSNYGIWQHEVGSDEKNILVDGNKYPVFAEKEPDKLPWKDLAVDVVIESTGRFTDQEGSKLHLQAGAKKVVISAPTKGDGSSVPTLLLGVNGEKYSGDEIISNSSCTTNCIAPVAKVMNDKFGILKAMMTTVHAYTQDQNLQDGPHKDLRRARGAAQNIVPTTTGAAISTTEVIPELKGKFDGVAIRVPVAVGSISDFTFLLSKKVTIEEVNQAFKEAADSPHLRGILVVTDEPVVSSDIVGRSESAIVDLSLTQVVDGDMVKVFAWYDNEYGYSCRLVEQVINVGKSINS